jgi:tetratricopeptide (TPR) repeat protein
VSASITQALSTYRSLPESNSTLGIKIANVYTNLGVVYGLRKVHDKEMDLFKKALHFYQKHHGYEHVNTAMAFNNLGIASRNQGDRSLAMACFKKSLGIYRGLYGERHPECIRTQRNIDRLRTIWQKAGIKL